MMAEMAPTALETILLGNLSLLEVDRLSQQSGSTHSTASVRSGMNSVWEQTLQSLPNQQYRTHVQNTAIHIQKMTKYIEMKLYVGMVMHLLMIAVMLAVLIFLGEQLLGTLAAILGNNDEEFRVRSPALSYYVTGLFQGMIQYPLIVRYSIPLMMVVLTVLLVVSRQTRYQLALCRWVPFYGRCFTHLAVSKWLRLTSDGIESDVPVLEVANYSSRFLNDAVTNRIPRRLADIEDPQGELLKDHQLYRYEPAISRLISNSETQGLGQSHPGQAHLAALLDGDAELLEQSAAIGQQKIALYLEPLLLMFFAAGVVLIMLALYLFVQKFLWLMGALSIISDPCWSVV